MKKNKIFTFLFYKSIIIISFILISCVNESNNTSSNSNNFTQTSIKIKLNQIKYWTYNIQDINTQRQRDQLVGSHFDLYVLEPTVTEVGEENFDIAKLIQDIRQYNITTRNVEPIILAYIDIGQAESWRWYWTWSKVWESGKPKPADWPEYIVASDPDGWDDCYVVAYWYKTWEDICIYGYNGKSHVEESLKAGFDGIYMDWVEAFSDEDVINKDKTIDTATKMFDFIEKIRNYARKDSPNKNPDYLIVAQNAPDLYDEDPTRYYSLIDAIACEAVWYDGKGGDGDKDGKEAGDDWDDPEGYNTLTNDLYAGWTEEVIAYLKPIKSYMPVFCVEYAQDIGGKNLATAAYSLANTNGYICYCTRRSLQELSTTPYPPGYTPIDY